METVWRAPLPLLLMTGGLLGATFPLGKLTAAAGISPVIWAFLIACGSGLVLLAALLVSGRTLPLDRASLIYYGIAALISYAIPNILLFAVIPYVGAGYAGIMFTLSPMLTLLLSLVFAAGRTGLLGSIGILIGFAGALTIALSRVQDGQAVNRWALLLAFAIPLSLAIGNVYRTLAWPRNGNPIALAAGSNLAAAALLFVISLAATGGFPVAALLKVPHLAAIQIVCSVLMFTFFFQLQAVGGPVYLSQIGYVAAAVGMFSSIVFLGERYGVMTFAGVAVIVMGIVLTTLAQRR